MKIQIWLGLLVSLIIACPAAAENRVPALPVPAGAAMILNMGWDDAAGYRIVVWPSGITSSVDAAGHAHGLLPGDLVDRFFHDLTIAMPLSQLPSHTCSRAPMSLLPTFLTLRGEHSSDVSCGGDDKSSALLWDVQTIARVLYVGNYRVKPIGLFFQPNGAPASSVAQPPLAPPVQPQPAATAPSYPSSGYGPMGY